MPRLPAIRPMTTSPTVIDAEVTVLHERGGYAPTTLDPIIQTLVGNMQAQAELLKTNGPLLVEIMARLQADLLTSLKMTKAIDPNGLNTDGTVDEHATVKASAAAAAILDLANKATIIMERMQKSLLNAGKTIDDATRLRTFLMTGDEDPAGLDGLGEQALRKIILQAAKGDLAGT